MIDTAHRRHQHIRYVDERVKLPDYDGEIRQVAVTGLGLLPSACYALQSIKGAMCSSGLCAARLSNLYKLLFHQPSPDFARLPDFT